ncbi:MAG: AraC family transcriptional regulator [Monoglobales bacterium]
MLKNIIRYIEFLKNEENLDISIHGINPMFGSFVGFLIPYNIHFNPYCLYAKSFKGVKETCWMWQEKVGKKCGGEVFFGCCHAGVAEFVVPVNDGKDFLGFISVSGYWGGNEKIDAFSQKTGVPSQILCEMADKHLLKEIPDKEKIETLLTPLAAMLVLSYREYPKGEFHTNAEYIYGKAVAYIYSNYHQKIRIDDIAAECHVSNSHVAHIFKQKSGQSIGAFLTEHRIKKAKQILENTDMSINDTAFCVGFEDGNYFINVFKKAVGLSPGAYRKDKAAHI